MIWSSAPGHIHNSRKPNGTPDVGQTVADRGTSGIGEPERDFLGCCLKIRRDSEAWPYAPKISM